jgi:signal transduction histidine kinase
MAAKRKPTRKTGQSKATVPRTAQLLAYVEALGATARQPLLVCDAQLRVKSANGPFCQAFGLSANEVRNCSLYELNDGEWDIPELRQALLRVVAEGVGMNDLALERTFRQLGPRTLRLSARRLSWPRGPLTLIVLAIEGLTRHAPPEPVGRPCRRCDVRQRLGQQLHDDVGQELTGLALKAETLADVSQRLPERRLAREVVRAIGRVREKLRTLVSGQFPADIEEAGLAARLQRLASHTSALYGIACTFTTHDRAPVEDPNVATQLDYVAQEAIHNAVRHGRARHVAVTLDTSADRVILQVRDDGVGIPPPPKRGKGMGLSIMRYRTDRIGGTLTIKAGARRGTLVVCNVPRSIKPT